MELKNKNKKTPRIKVIQKLYSHSIYPDQVILFNNGQYKKFIKDVVLGTIERNDLIVDTVNQLLGSDINLKRTDKLLKIILFAAIFELLFKHNNTIGVIIGEYLKTSEFFLEKAQVKYLNAILDKISKLIRKS